MADTFNINLNSFDNIIQEIKKESAEDVVFFPEEVTVTKTEVKEEGYDFEMSIDYPEFVNVKEEGSYSSEEVIEHDNMRFENNTERLLNEKLEVGNYGMRKLDLQSNKYSSELRQSDFNKAVYSEQYNDVRTSHRKRNLDHNSIDGKDKAFKCTYIICKCIPGQEKFCECNMCQYRATNEYLLKNHMLMKHAKKYECKDCKYTTRWKKCLVLHMSKHTGEKPYKCTYKDCKCDLGQEEPCECNMCEYASADKYNLQKHMLAKHSTDQKDHSVKSKKDYCKEYKCKECEYTTSRKECLVVHIRNHTGEKPFKCTYKNCKCATGQDACECNTCEFACRSKCYLNKHILEKHSKEPKQYKCEECEYSTSRKACLVVHIHSHTGEKPFKCTYKNCKCAPGQEQGCECTTCEFACRSKCYLNQHILLKHSKEAKQYKCTECEYTTYKKSCLVVHIRNHTGEKPFKCTYKDCKCEPGQEEPCECNTCEFACRSKCNLTQHILVKHSKEPNKYKCKDCEYSTHNKVYLKVHIRNHSNDKSFKCTYKNCKCLPEQEEACECNTCEFVSTKKRSLKHHILVKHTTESQKYKCEYCEYTTHSKAYSILHSRIHTHEKPFKCTYKNCKCTPNQKESCECEMCGFEAARKDTLNQHLRLCHSQ